MQKNILKKTWKYLQKDTWDSWLVSLILIIILIKFILFPTLAYLTGTPLPLVVVESCSMYHNTNFNSWWEQNSLLYKTKNISLEEFNSFPLKRGLNKGDIIFVVASKEYKRGDIIIFNAKTQYPIIHRIINSNPISTKGDNNANQLPFEKEISQKDILGKAVLKMPYLGWTKLIFFEPLKSPEKRGFC
ncbi:signal peptidase I [Candidatus Pacearchaeota archaeon CG10_big_fil_rev_8_21_14_0_10_31_24]|nr:MAG: signal peptidase I [Candidatus Pacearchaeota archaeon CG10_big_fil_rev_8_21_14_0_10_31_24]